MIYNFLDDFCKMKTTVYLYSEYTDKDGNFKQSPLSKPLRKDVLLGEILCSFKLDYLFKNSNYGKTLKDVTIKARTYSHGSLEYNDIKMHMPGYTWAGVIGKEDILDEYTQEVYEKRKRRSNDNIIPNGLVCIEFDEVEPSKVDDLIQKALRKFPHLVYAGRTLSNKMFCMHRADDKLTNINYIRYYKELAVLYYNEIGIVCDDGVQDISRCRYMCDQCGARYNLEYCDFSPSDDIEVEYDKIFKVNEETHIRRVKDYVPAPDENIYEYEDSKGYYYGHGKNHLMQIQNLIIPIPSITQMINTLIALGKTREEIKQLWKTKLKYYNYNTNSRNTEDPERLSVKFKTDTDEYSVGKSTYLFLQMFFPDIVGIKSHFLAKDEFLCDRFFDFLSDSIISHDKILIHGDTGIGKTYFANKLNTKHKVIVVVPYIAHMSNYPEYTRIDDVNEENDVVSSAVVIWDRFIKLYNRGLIDKESIIIIDESHKLFLDQTYRAAAIGMNHILKEISNHICYISATPIKEVDVDVVYRFEKERRIVNVNHMKIIGDEGSWPSSTLTINAMLHLIYGNINYYDHIFIASDKYAQKIFDRLYGKYDCQLIRASQKDSKEYLELMKTQLMSHKIIVGTCISYEAINFNNKNEKILTISDMNENTTAEIITQIAGRVRFSYNKVYIIELIRNINKIDYNELAEFYNKLEQIKSKYNLYSRQHYIQQYVEELDDVSEWYYENNNIDKIKENLPFYIKWSESEILAHNVSDKSPLNESVKEYICDHVSKYKDELNLVDIVIDELDYDMFMFFNESNFIEIKETGQSAQIIRESIRSQQYEYRKLAQYVNYDKINDLIVQSHSLPKGINSDIYHIIDIIKLDEDKYNSYHNDLINYRDSIGYDIGYHILDKTIKNIEKMRKVYLDCYSLDEFEMYNNIFDCIAKNRIEKFVKKQEMWSIIGSGNTKSVKITTKFKHPEKYNLTIGQEFESLKSLSNYTNKNRKTITQWKNKNWIE